MPTNLGNVANAQLKALAQGIVDGGQKPDGKTIGAIVAALGVDGQSQSVLDGLKSGALPPDQMLPVAQAALGKQPGSAKDLQALLAQPAFTAALDGTSLNFLRAAVGMEALRAGGTFGSAPVVPQDVLNAQLGAVQKMKEWAQSGALQRYYDAYIDIGDVALKADAAKVFEALPTFAADASADDFVKAGIWAAAPRGIDVMQKSARYLPGRQLLVETNINANTGDYRGFLSYDANGPLGKTYRATMVGEQGDQFLVKVDGKNDPIAVPKARVYELNQPHFFAGEKFKEDGTPVTANDRWGVIDMTDPLTKAKVVEAAIAMADDVAKLDFTKMKTQGRGIGAMFGGGGAEEMTAVQRRCVKEIHDVIKMTYDNDGSPGRVGSGSRGRMATKGAGSCYTQAGVMLALLLPFRSAIGVDVQFISGGVYRNTKSSDPPAKQFSSYANQAHGWLQVTYRPKMETRIVDRTWRQPDHEMDRAYSVGGDRYPTTNNNDNVQPVSATDVNFTGDVSVQTYDRQFGVLGRDGRENHMSNAERRARELAAAAAAGNGTGGTGGTT
jgi:hypothetical protein